MIVDFLDLLDDGLKRFTRFAHQRHPCTDMLARFKDKVLDLLGSCARPLRQFAHLLGDHGKALASLAGAGGLDTSVEGQQVGLEGNIVDDADDVRYFASRTVDEFHCLDSAPDRCARLFRV